jgi:hypothetical protein
MILVRFILRFLLVPIGGAFAAVAAIVVVIGANWEGFLKIVSSDPGMPENFFLVVIWGPAIIALTPVVSFVMLTLATIGVVISEVFAIRSILYHVGSGALATWIGWAMMRQFHKDFELFNDPTFLIAGGIAAGLIYWLIAGWSAGFWKPVFSQPLSPPPTAAPA